MNEQGPQVCVAASADAVQAALTAGGILSRHEAQPGGQMPAVAKLLGVADRNDNGRGGERANTRDLCDLPAQR